MNKPKENNKTRFVLSTVIIISLLLCLAVGLVLAAGDSVTRSLVSSGGGALQQAGIRLQSSIGQPVAGTVGNGLTLCSGFNCGSIEGGFQVYLPMVVRP
jgi:hypothetical protein